MNYENNNYNISRQDNLTLLINKSANQSVSELIKANLRSRHRSHEPY